MYAALAARYQPPPADTPAGDMQADHQPVAVIQIAQIAHIESNAQSSTAGRSTAPPSRVPSYYAHTPRSSVIPPLVNHDLPEKGWDYITPPAGSPPPQ